MDFKGHNNRDNIPYYSRDTWGMLAIVESYWRQLSNSRPFGEGASWVNSYRKGQDVELISSIYFIDSSPQIDFSEEMYYCVAR